MSKIELGAIALALSLSAALPVDVPYASGLFGAPTAQAGVLSTIKSGAQKVGSAAKVPPPRSAATPPPRSPSLPKPPTYDPPKPPTYEPKPPAYEPKPSPYGLKSTNPAPRAAPPNQGLSKPDLGIKQDKSVWGRPVGVSKPKLTSNSTRDLKPMRQSTSRKAR